ncbi:hypothetical protein IWW55_000371 [Coemansia sp. RSA 2706]|nr:hypothetical protein IWW55_000371 [Coemansia sp. RSA 2706]
MESSYPSLLPVLWFVGAWALVNLGFVLARLVCRRTSDSVELVSPLHVRITTRALNGAVEAIAQSPRIARVLDGFYAAGVLVGVASMVLCTGLLGIAAIQIAAAIGIRAGAALPSVDLWQPLVALAGGSAGYAGPAEGPEPRLGRRLAGDAQVLQPIIPGVTLPAGHLWHYLVALAACAVIHELGHACAAARARVPMRACGVFLLGIYPGAFVELCPRLVARSGVGRRLRIVCAGVWHNAVTALAVWALVRSGGLGAAFARAGWSQVTDAVVVTEVAGHSPLQGRLPLRSIVHRIDDVRLGNASAGFGATAIARWTGVLTAGGGRGSTDAGFCVDARANQDDGLCCEMSARFPLGESPDAAIFCFEMFAGERVVRAQPWCFDLRAVLAQSARCRTSRECLRGDVCVVPRAPYASGRALRLYYRAPGSRREEMLVYAGSPAELWLEVQVSSLEPRFAWLPLALPAGVETLLQYVLSFSLAFCLLNALPAWHLDGNLALKLLIAGSRRRQQADAGVADKQAAPEPQADGEDDAANDLGSRGQLLYTVVGTSTTVLLVWCAAGSILLLAL